MDPALNPYSPGAGLRPPALTGRQAELDRIDVMIKRAKAGLPSRGMVLTGLRGVGKTVLLREIRSRVQTAGWLELHIEGMQSEPGQDAVRARLARELLTASRRLERKSRSAKLKAAFDSITSFSLSAGLTGGGLSVERAAPGRADSGNFETDLTELVEDVATAAAETGTAFAIVIDEMQDVGSDSLAALIAAQHRSGQEGWPFYILGAGLPSLQRVLSEARSYAERLFDYRAIGALDHVAASAALTEPAQQFGAAYTATALDTILDAARGYPYFLQEYGRAIWDCAADNPFSGRDANTATSEGTRQLDHGFFRARWDRATKTEREFLAAMTPDSGDPSPTSAIAERMNKTLSGNGPARAALIHKGLIYAPEHGQVAYTVPGMADFINRQHT